MAMGQRKRPAAQDPEPPRRSKRQTAVVAAIAPKKNGSLAKPITAAPTEPLSQPPQVDKVIASRPPPITTAHQPASTPTPIPSYVHKVNEWLAANNPAEATLATMTPTEPAVSAAPRHGWKTSEFEGCIRLDYNIRLAYEVFRSPLLTFERFRDREILKLENSKALGTLYGLKGWSGSNTIRNVNALISLFENFRDKRTDSAGIDALCRRRGISRAIYDEWNVYRDKSEALAARREKEFLELEEEEEEDEDEDEPYNDDDDDEEEEEEEEEEENGAEEMTVDQLWQFLRLLGCTVAAMAAFQRRHVDNHEREIRRLRERLHSHKCWDNS
ncbi:hypothetical protein HDU81_006104 [Chytriomyces hyalinus]|nr:hypothetical protein HDU81_006104 [Chytriomyces hyalinus]